LLNNWLILTNAKILTGLIMLGWSNRSKIWFIEIKSRKTTQNQI